MSPVDSAFAFGLILALAFSIGNTRAWAWLLAGAASYVVSTLYWRSGLPYGAFIGGLCDAAICLAVYFWGKLRWEQWVWRLFQVSVAVNVIYLGITLDGDTSRLRNEYSIMLELVNWAALFFIGGTGAAQHIGASSVAHAAHRPWGSFYRAVEALYRKRTAAPFHRAGR